MELTNQRDLRAALQLAGVTPRTKLDQHFLIDHEALTALLQTADLQANDTVLEIGAGPGVITQAVAALVKQVVAIELDPRFADILKRADWSNVTVVNEDFRRFDLATLPKKYKVVAGLPYGITSYVLQRLLTDNHKPDSITVMVQKEVAERVTAKPGALSVLSLSVQYFGEPKLGRIVPSTSFYPAPAVDSAILYIAVRPQPAFVADEKQLFRLIKVGFAARRKMLKNNLAAGMNLPIAEVESRLKIVGIPLTARAQELSLEQWQQLYMTLHS